MTQALTAARDTELHRGSGFSVTGLLRSAYDDVLGSGRSAGRLGRSRCSTRRTRTRHATRARTRARRSEEIFIAMKLAHQRSERGIMTQYLNTVPVGTDHLRCRGSGRAVLRRQPHSGPLGSLPAGGHVGGDADPAGLLQPGSEVGRPVSGAAQPVRVRPEQHAPRWQYHRSQKAAAAATFPKLSPPPAGNGQSGYTGYLMEMVKQELETVYGYSYQAIITKGFNITTTFNLNKIKALARTSRPRKVRDCAPTARRCFARPHRLRLEEDMSQRDHCHLRREPDALPARGRAGCL